MRMRAMALAAVGILSAGLVAGPASAATAAPAAPRAAGASFTATAWAWATSDLIAMVEAREKLETEYTGCTNVIIFSNYQWNPGWEAEAKGTCTGTA